MAHTEQLHSKAERKTLPTKKESMKIESMAALREFATGLVQMLHADVEAYIAQSEALQTAIDAEAHSEFVDSKNMQSIARDLDENTQRLRTLVSDAQTSVDGILGSATEGDSEYEALDNYFKARFQVMEGAVQALPVDQQKDIEEVQEAIRDLSFDADEFKQVLGPFAGKEEEVELHIIKEAAKEFAPEVLLGVLKGMDIHDDLIVQELDHLGIPKAQRKNFLMEAGVLDVGLVVKHASMFRQAGIGLVDVLRELADKHPNRMTVAMQKLHLDQLGSSERHQILDIAVEAAEKVDAHFLAKEKEREEIKKQREILAEPFFEIQEAPKVIERARQVSERLTEALRVAYPERISLIDVQTQKEQQLEKGKIERSASISGTANAPEEWHFEGGGAAVYKSRKNEQPCLRDGIPAGTYAAREWLVFQIDRALQLNIVPVTALRQGADGFGSVQEWKNDTAKTAFVLGKKTWRRLAKRDDLERIGLLDSLTVNSDRHQGNFLVDATGKVHAIDNGLTFSELDTGADRVRSRPLDVVGGKAVSSSLQEQVQRYAEQIELQKILKDAFEVALGEKGEQAYEQFTQKITSFLRTGVLPKSDW